MSLTNQDLKQVFELALIHHKKCNFKKAEKLYNEILKSIPNHFQSIFLLGTLFGQTKKYVNAVVLLKKAIR